MKALHSHESLTPEYTKGENWRKTILQCRKPSFELEFGIKAEGLGSKRFVGFSSGNPGKIFTYE